MKKHFLAIKHKSILKYVWFSCSNINGWLLLQSCCFGCFWFVRSVFLKDWCIVHSTIQYIVWNSCWYYSTLKFWIWWKFWTGMSDLCSPMIILLNDEADAFWCFERLMRRLVCYLLMALEVYGQATDWYFVWYDWITCEELKWFLNALFVKIVVSFSMKLSFLCPIKHSVKDDLQWTFCAACIFCHEWIQTNKISAFNFS